MKKWFFILLVFPFAMLAQDNKEAISEIRKLYKATEEMLPDCKQIVVNDWVDEEEYSGYTPIITAYWDTISKTFVKIEEYGSADWHEVTTSYYINQGELYFLFDKGYTGGEMYTAEELGITDQELWERGWEAKTINYYEKRVYINEDVIIRCLDKYLEAPANENDPDLGSILNVPGTFSESDYTALKSHVQKILEMLSNR